mmetsp:Transcript_78140/g.95688  ORF Transcript_78140/g.95688 Transcript_78140/m.95688 type:complete len:167 (-) Transcript_78140:450-950(-)
MARSNSVFAFKNLQAIDKLTLSIVGGVYLLLLWLPVMVSLYLLCTTGNNEEFKHKKWLWKWKKQWVYISVWFRLHVVITACMLTIFIFERDFTIIFEVIFGIFICLATITLYLVQRALYKRIPKKSGDGNGNVKLIKTKYNLFKDPNLTKSQIINIKEAQRTYTLN